MTKELPHDCRESCGHGGQRGGGATGVAETSARLRAGTGAELTAETTPVVTGVR